MGIYDGTFFGTANNDTFTAYQKGFGIFKRWGAWTIYGNNGDDVLTGGPKADALYGHNGRDTLNGLDGDDTLYGGDGIDRLDGGAGSDRMTGGDGSDVYIVDSRFDRVFESANQGTDTVYSSVRYTLGDHVEQLVLKGAATSGVGNSLNNIIVGTNADNFLDGKDGNDRIVGLGGNDFIIGGDGNDALYGSSGIDNLTGGDGDDYLDGGADSDILNGGKGKDRMYGRAGDDQYLVFEKADKVYEYAGEGTDLVTAFRNYTLTDHVENLTLWEERKARLGKGNTLGNKINGNRYNNKLYGVAGDDTLNGAAGNDFLYGGDDDDLLSGGLGRDELYGGRGTDTLQGADSYTDKSKDKLSGGDGADVFVLGDAGGNFYTTGRKRDYALIRDFDWREGDTIQVEGDRNNFSLGQGNYGGNRSKLDTEIFYKGDLIGVAQDTSGLLLSADFNFV